MADGAGDRCPGRFRWPLGVDRGSSAIRAVELDISVRIVTDSLGGKERR
jgi:hypothetical protein